MVTRWLPTWTLVPEAKVPGGALEAGAGARYAAGWWDIDDAAEEA